MERTGEAHRFTEDESITGKVVIKINDDGNVAKAKYQQTRKAYNQNKNYIGELIVTGIIAGMRSLSAPVVARKVILNTSGDQLHSSRLRFLKSPTVSAALKILAATEFLSDKHPSVPARTKPASLVVRAVSGAISSASVARKTQHNAYVGALAGGVAAVLATYGMYYLRTSLTKKTKLPGIVLGLLEDAVVVAAGAIVSQSSKRKS